MGSIEKIILVYCLFLVLTQVSSVFELNNTPNGDDACKQSCRQTYAPGLESEDNLDLGSLEDSCLRGCRFYSIVETINRTADHIGTVKSCFFNCRDAYLGLYKQNQACRTGCTHQQPYKPEVSKVAEDQPPVSAPVVSDQDVLSSILYPLIQVHSLYSNVVRHASLSFFTVQDEDGNTGRLIVVQSQEPQAVPDFKELKSQDFEDYLPSQRIGPLVDTTEVASHSQIKSAKASGEEINASEATSSPSRRGSSSGDWLTCLAQRTGVPRIFLCVLLLLSALSMVWLCMSAAATAPNHHVKLSINSGDLSYIRSLPEKKGILGVYPQAAVEARPLPAKIAVEKL